MTFMSYLHIKEDEPRVSVMVTPVCEVTDCTLRGRYLADDLIKKARGKVMNERTGETKSDKQPPARNAHCPCGSDRKYKKCCGRSTAMNDVD